MLRAFVDNAPAVFIIKEAEGRYVYLNRFVAASFRRSDLLGKSLYDLMPAAAADASREKELETLRTGRLHHSHEIFPGPDGAFLSASLARFRIDTPSGPLLAVLGLDVTELTRTESGTPRSSTSPQTRFTCARISRAAHVLESRCETPVWLDRRRSAGTNALEYPLPSGPEGR